MTQTKMFGFGRSDTEREMDAVRDARGTLTALAQDFQSGAHIYMRCRDALDQRLADLERQARDDGEYSDTRPMDEKASGAHGVYR